MSSQYGRNGNVAAIYYDDNVEQRKANDIVLEVVGEEGERAIRWEI